MQQQRNSTRCAVMRAALVVLLSVCEHPAARQWVAIMPEAASLAHNLIHLTPATSEQQLLCEAGHTLAAMISGQFTLHPHDQTDQHVNSSSWFSAGQEGQRQFAYDGQQASPWDSPGASTAVECFPISPTPDPTTLVNIVSHMRQRHKQHHGNAWEAPTTQSSPPHSATPTLPAESQRAFMCHSSTIQSAQRASAERVIDADDGNMTCAGGAPFECPSPQCTSAAPLQTTLAAVLPQVRSCLYISSWCLPVEAVVRPLQHSLEAESVCLQEMHSPGAPAPTGPPQQSRSSSARTVQVRLSFDGDANRWQLSGLESSSAALLGAVAQQLQDARILQGAHSTKRSEVPCFAQIH